MTTDDLDRPVTFPTVGAPITTVDELDALPVGSVVLDRHGDSWQKVDDTDRTDNDGGRLPTAWASCAWTEDRTAREVFEGIRGATDYTKVGPLTVLYRPDARPVDVTPTPADDAAVERAARAIRTHQQAPDGEGPVECQCGGFDGPEDIETHQARAALAAARAGEAEPRVCTGCTADYPDGDPGVIHRHYGEHCACGWFGQSWQAHRVSCDNHGPRR